MKSKIVRGYLIFGSVYMFIESVIHFFNFRLADVKTIWPTSALTYAASMNTYYALLALFVSLLLFYLQTDLKKNKPLVKLMAIFALFHAAVLTLTSATINFDAVYQHLPSLGFWMPSYNGYLFIEIFMLLTFVAVVYFWQKD